MTEETAKTENTEKADKGTGKSGGDNDPVKMSLSSGKLTFLGRLRGYLLAGILVTAPISITIFLTWMFIQFIDNTVSDILPEKYNPETYMPFTIPGLGLVIAITFLITVGWFATNFLGRIVYSIADYTVHRLPVVRNLYGAIKQIMETIMASQSQAFREVVMLEYPRKGVWSIGFVTGRSKGEVQRLTDTETINVFVPTTPNPTSGYLLFVPKAELHFLKMTVEEGVKLVVSAGIVTPEEIARQSEESKKKGAKKTNPDENQEHKAK